MSLEDQMVDRWLFMEMVSTQLNQVASSMCKTGWSPLPEGFRDLRNAFRGKTLATDCSSFDWTFPEWAVKVVFEALLDQCVNATPNWIRAMKRRVWEVLGPGAKMHLPDGSRYQKRNWGIMFSGWFLTILLNSYAQLSITALAWKRAYPSLEFPLIWGMGDDVLMDWPLTEAEVDGFVKELKKLGIKLKQYAFVREFAGFGFDGNRVDPLYPDKHCFVINNTARANCVELANNLAQLYALASPLCYAKIAPFVERFSHISRSVARAWALGMIADLGVTTNSTTML